METVDNLPLEIQTFDYIAVATVNRYKKDVYKYVRKVFKSLGFTNITVLRLPNEQVVGVIAYNSQGHSILDIDQIWSNQVGYLSGKRFIKGRPVEKQLTNCGYPVKKGQYEVVRWEKRKVSPSSSAK